MVNVPAMNARFICSANSAQPCRKQRLKMFDRQPELDRLALKFVARFATAKFARLTDLRFVGLVVGMLRSGDLLSVLCSIIRPVALVVNDAWFTPTAIIHVRDVCPVLYIWMVKCSPKTL